MLRWRLCCLGLAGIMLLGAAGSVAYAQSTVRVDMMEFQFQPSTLRVAPGAVTFQLQNTGQFPHTVHIDGMDNDVTAAPVPGGESETATVNLAPGTYTFWCPVDGHRDRGMEGTLIVAAGAQSARAGGWDPLQIAGVLALGGIGAMLAGLRRKRSAV